MQITHANDFSTCSVPSPYDHPLGARMGRKNTDLALRERLSKWVRYFMALYGITTENQGEFAARLGISGPALSQYKNARRTMGLDTFVRMHRSMKMSADVMLSADPPPTRAQRSSGLALKGNGNGDHDGATNRE